MLFKIFLTFWLTLALLAAGQEIVSMLAQKDEQAALADARVLVAEAQSVPDAYDRGGAVAAREAAGRLEKDRGARADVLDDTHRSLLGDEVRPAVLATARLAQRAAAQGSKLAIVNIGEHAAAKQVTTPSGGQLMLIVDLPRHAAARAVNGWALSPIARYAAVILVGGLLCFALARHISRPLVKLAGAANALADGRLHTRVGGRITRRHDEVGRLARDFDRMAERIEALVAGQRRLLGDASHELRSPLARLTVAAGLARRSAPTESAEYFDRIDTEAARLDRLIEQLLTLARIESTVDDELRGDVNLTELVQEVVSDGDFEARASGKRVTLVASEETVLHGRADLLRSAVENIVRNAIRYTQPGTAVEVRLERSGSTTGTGTGATARTGTGTRTVASSSVQSSGQPSRHVMLTVRDHGPGVPDARVSDIFRRFWRAAGSAPESPDGAGLGLAIADSVVRIHGGTIGAANEGHGGLLVTIELPIG